MKILNKLKKRIFLRKFFDKIRKNNGMFYKIEVEVMKNGEPIEKFKLYHSYRILFIRFHELILETLDHNELIQIIHMSNTVIQWKV